MSFEDLARGVDEALGDSAESFSAAIRKAASRTSEGIARAAGEISVSEGGQKPAQVQIIMPEMAQRPYGYTPQAQGGPQIGEGPILARLQALRQGSMATPIQKMGIVGKTGISPEQMALEAAAAQAADDEKRLRA